MSGEAAVTREAAAARWWAPRLGTDEETGLGDSAGRVSRTDEERERFRAALEEVTGEHLRECRGCGGGLHGWHSIKVDYDPDALLCAAAERARITLQLYELAKKTSMVLDDEGIRVSDGYAAPWVFIWRYRAEDDECATWLREQAAGIVAAARGPEEAAPAESVLAVIREYERLWQWAADDAELGAADRSTQNQAKALKKAVRLLAYGYRHREGWQETWKP